MQKKAIIGTLALILFFSCEDKYELIDSKTTVPDPKKINGDTILYDSSGSFYYSRITKINTQGLLSQFTLPDEFKTKDLEVVFNGRIRTNYAQSNTYINIVPYDRNGVMLGWNGVSLRYYFTEINKWCYFKDSIHLKFESWNQPFHLINTFSYLGNSTKEKFDLDCLHVQIKVRK